MVIKDVNYIKGIAEGTLQNILNNDVLDKDRLYLIDDLPSTCSITNKMMQDALGDLKIKACFVEGDIYICSDTGIYKENTFYKFAGDHWQEIVVPSAETDGTGTNIAQKFSQIDRSLDSLEETTSILINNGDGTKYLADDGQYKEVVSGIEQLVGTAETPVNLYNLKSGQLYAVQNYVGSTSDYYTITSGTLLVYKQSSNICIFEHCRLVSSSRIINITNSTLSQSYLVTIKSNGQLTIEVASTGVNRLNGSTDYLGPVSFFAPINGGANGQILQANGYSTAPTWVTPNYVSQSYVDEQIANLGQTTESKNLKLPEVAPGVQQIVSINSDGTQQNLTLGEGVSIENGVLNASGGKLYQHHITFLSKGRASIITNSETIFTVDSLKSYLKENGFSGLGPFYTASGTRIYNGENTIEIFSGITEYRGELRAQNVTSNVLIENSAIVFSSTQNYSNITTISDTVMEI